jgi:hypothetical protein
MQKGIIFKPLPWNYVGIVTNMCLIAIACMLIFICTVLPPRIQSLRSELSEINAKFVQPEIFSKFPSNQIELTTRQILSIIENTHKISARSKFLLEKMEPEYTVAMVGDLKTIVERMSNLLEKNTTDKLLEMVDQINRIPVKKVGESLALLDMNKLNQLAESTKLIEEKLNKIHEIKIQI